MHNEDEIISRCPLGDRIFSFIIAMVILVNTTSYSMRINAVNEPIEETEIIETVVEEPIQDPIIENDIVEEPALKSDDEIISEINTGKWGDGENRKNNLIAAGYDYFRIQSKINNQYVAKKSLRTEAPTMEHTYTSRLTKRGGIYNNPYTGLKETWYSQRVLPGGGLDIPGRHINDEGFVCDKDGYICVASSTYPKGTIIETSRGMGKVYDSGCKPGILDVYVNW